MNRREFMAGTAGTAIAAALPVVPAIETTVTQFAPHEPIGFCVGLNQRATYRWIAAALDENTIGRELVRDNA